MINSETVSLHQEQQNHWIEIKELLENFNAEWNLANAVFRDLSSTAISYLSINKDKIYSQPLLPPQLRYVFTQVQTTQAKIEGLLETVIANTLLLCVRDKDEYLKYTSEGHNVSNSIREAVYKCTGLTETEWSSRKEFITGCIENTFNPSSVIFNQFTSKEIENLQREKQTLFPIKKWRQLLKSKLLKLLPGRRIAILPVLWLVSLTII